MVFVVVVVELALLMRDVLLLPLLSLTTDTSSVVVVVAEGLRFLELLLRTALLLPLLLHFLPPRPFFISVTTTSEVVSEGRPLGLLLIGVSAVSVMV